MPTEDDKETRRIEKRIAKAQDIMGMYWLGSTYNGYGLIVHCVCFLLVL